MERNDIWESLSYHGTTVGSPNSKYEIDLEFAKAGTCAASIVASETFLTFRTSRGCRVTSRAGAEAVRFPVPDTSLIGPGDQLELAVAVPVDRGRMDAVPPELQRLAVIVP